MDFAAAERHHGFSLSDIAYRLSGKTAVVESEVISGRKLNVLFTFYNKESFYKDQKEWADYQKKVYAAREKGQKAEGFKNYDLPGFPFRRRIGYNEFIKISVPFFSRIIFQAFADHPDLFYNKMEITVQVKIMPAGRWEEKTTEKKEAKEKYEFVGAFPSSPVEKFADKALQEGILDMDHYYTEFTGLYVLQAVVAPYIFFRKIDYNFLYKYIVHEMDHYHSCALRYYEYDEGLTKRLGHVMSKASDYSLSYLHGAISDLKSEGIADFRKKANAPRIMISPKIIRNFRHRVEKILAIRKKRALEKYYEDEIYAGTMEGVYYCGYIACFFIAYSREPDTAAVSATLKRGFANQANFYLRTPSRQAYAAAFKEMAPLDPIAFLKLYEEACKKLGLGPNDMMITYEEFAALWKQAEKNYDVEELAKIKRAGYYPFL